MIDFLSLRINDLDLLASDLLSSTAFFCRGFSFDLVTRVWDVLLLEGRMKPVYRVSLAILQSVSREVLALRFDRIMALLRELPQRLDSAKLVDDCWALPLKTEHIVEAEKEVS